MIQSSKEVTLQNNNYFFKSNFSKLTLIVAIALSIIGVLAFLKVGALGVVATHWYYFEVGAAVLFVTGVINNFRKSSESHNPQTEKNSDPDQPLISTSISEAQPSTHQTSSHKSLFANKTSSQSFSSLLNQLTKEQIGTLIFNVLTESSEERKTALEEISQLGENKSIENKAREACYKLPDRPSIILYLIRTIPNLKTYIDSLNSNMVYESLTDYVKTLESLKKIEPLFLLLNDTHRCTLLQTLIGKKKIFLALLEKEPSVSIELKKKPLPELFDFAQDLLNSRNVKDVFYHVYASLSDEDQKKCLKQIITEKQFESKRVELIIKTDAAIQYSIEVIEYVFEGLRDKTGYSGKINPCLQNKTTKLFDELLPFLPQFNIVTFFWRIARVELNVWSTNNGWIPHFQGSTEEKLFFKSLSFDQVTRLNKFGQPWMAMWHPSEQPDDMIVHTCFSQLKRANQTITKYKNKEYDPEGILFKKNFDNFLVLLTFEQVSMLICRDPSLIELNQIFGFDELDQEVPEKLLNDIYHFPQKYDRHLISIPAILQRWWVLAEQNVNTDKRISTLQDLQIEQKYISYFTHIHTEYEKIRPFVEESVRNFQRIFKEAQQDTKNWIKSGKSWNDFIQEKHNARIRAEQERKEKEKAQAEEKILFAYNYIQIKKSLQEIGLDPHKEYSKIEIEQFVRKELFKYHPDKHLNKSPEEKGKFEERFKEISSSRDTLLSTLETMKLTRTPA